ncbi:MAG TPA: fatty acid desaturase [Ilumatobacteraceae bacterium]
MPTELAPSVAEDSTLPLFAVPAEIRQWGARVRVADRNPLRATAMLLESIVLYGVFIAGGEELDSWWGWIIAWVGLVVCMMRVDAIHHEAVHRSLFVRRWPNDLIATFTGALEGFHGPTYRCFHLAHHALTRRDQDLSDPEAFYDEVLTRPFSIGPVHLGARAVYLVGMLAGGVTFAVQLMIGAIGTLFGRAPAFVGAASLERHIRRWGWLPFVLWGTAICGSVLSGHSAELIRWWLVPMLVFLCGPYTFFALPEHYAAPHNDPMVTATGSVRSTPMYRWLTLDGNFHLAHHVFPTASWWRLADADAQLRSVTTLRHTGYLRFHRDVWRELAATRPVSSASDNEESAT